MLHSQVRPCWQRQNASVMRMSYTSGLGVLTAFLLLRDAFARTHLGKLSQRQCAAMATEGCGAWAMHLAEVYREMSAKS